MNKLLYAAFAAVLLSGCDKPTPSAPAAGDAPASPPTAVSAEAAVPQPSPSPATTQPAAATAPASPASVTAAAVAADKVTDDAIDQLLGDHTRYRDVIDRFQKAVAAKDAAAVAALVDYPFDTTIDGKSIAVKNAADFVARYDKIVTPPITEAVVSQKYADLFVNYKGVMFGNGEAWITGICKDESCKHFDVKVVTLQPAG